LQGFAVLFGLLLDALNEDSSFVDTIKQIALAFTLVVCAGTLVAR
jgi:hypothetical protein